MPTEFARDGDDEEPGATGSTCAVEHAHAGMTYAWVPVSRPPGSSVPLLFYADGTICHDFVRFLRCPLYQGKSGAWQMLHARAITRLWDYQARATRLDALPSPSTTSLVGDFVEALLYGTMQADGSDPSGLYWMPLGWSETHRYLQALIRFANFQAEEGRALGPAIATVAPRSGLQLWNSFQNKRAYSLLAHLKDFEGASERRTAPPPFARQLLGSRQASRPSPFPKPLEAAFWVNGILKRRRRDVVRGLCPHAVRDALLFWLLLYGGLRKSEPLHLFLGDVAPDPDRGATVWLHHPESGHAPDTTLTRSEYLRRTHGLIPRCRLAISDPMFAGWKSVALNESSRPRGRYDRVHWITRHAGRFFWGLHTLYVTQIRPKTARHPYYFVNLSRSAYGRPMTIDALDDAFARALRRLGLVPDASQGLSPHAMRHRYGHALVEGNIEPKAIQLCMHHKHPASHLIYTRPSPQQLTEALQKAYAKIEAGVADFDPSSLGIKWRSDPLGIFSTSNPDLPPLLV